MTIEVGLPLNTLDGGAGAGVAGCNNIPAPAGNNQPPPNNSCYTGNWNGRIESIGNGGEAGSVSSVTSATNAGFVGASRATTATAPTGAMPPIQPLANRMA